MKDLTVYNSVGGVALLSVYLAETFNPIPSSFWQAFAVLALNSAGTLLVRAIREYRGRSERERLRNEKLDDVKKAITALRSELVALRQDFDESQRPRRSGTKRRS